MTTKSHPYIDKSLFVESYKNLRIIDEVKIVAVDIERQTSVENSGQGTDGINRNISFKRKLTASSCPLHAIKRHLKTATLEICLHSGCHCASPIVANTTRIRQKWHPELRYAVLQRWSSEKVVK